MSRTRRLAVDNNNTWVYRAFYDTDPNLGGDVTFEHAVDYIVLAPNLPDTDDVDAAGPAFLFYTSAIDATDVIVLWATGLVSLGLPTEAQIAFMNAASADTDFSLFPGAHIVAGFGVDASSIFYGVKPDHTEIGFGATQIFIYADHVRIDNAQAGAGLDFGTGVALSSDTGGTVFFDLTALIETKGTTGDDTIIASAAPQTLVGLGGNDTLSASRGAVTLDGGAGNDTLFGGAWADKLFGGDGNDVLKLGAGDFADGGAGRDTFVVIAGSTGSSVKGGDGTDRLRADYSSFNAPLVVDLAPVGNSGTLPSGIAFTGIEIIDVTGGRGNDLITGNSGANRLLGGAGADVLNGGEGNDLLDAGIGARAPEPVYTAGGADTAHPVSIDGTFNPGTSGDLPFVVFSGSDDGFGAFTSDSFAFDAADQATLRLSLRSSFFASSLVITVFDAGGNQVASFDPVTSGQDSFDLVLAAGRYVILVEAQYDFGSTSPVDLSIALSSGDVPERHDTLSGGTGNDIYYVHAADNIVAEKSGEGIDTVVADLSWQLGANVENLKLVGDAALSGTGNGLANRLTGNNAANVLVARGGKDALYGNDGADTLYGGNGVDTLNGGRGDDKLYGGPGNDRIYGNVGADVFYGGLGADVMFGGGDPVRDTFDYNTLEESAPRARDLIYNFVSGTDRIDLSGIDAHAGTAANEAFLGLRGNTATAYSVWYSKADLDADGAKDDLLLKADVNGDTIADFAVGLINIATIAAADIVF